MSVLSLRRVNPVLDIELRQRSRSVRSVILMTVFLIIMILVSLLVYEASSESSRGDFSSPSLLTNTVGRQMFEWVLFAQVAFLLLIVPATSAGSISGERDRQTLVPLQVTLIGPWGIFIGKVLSSSSFVLLLIVASLPVMAVPYLVGGISLGQILLALLNLLIVGLLLAVMGVACSAIFKRTQIATLMAYALCAALTVGTIIAMIAVVVVRENQGDFNDPPFWPLYANPFVALADSAGEIDSNGSGPFSPVRDFFVASRPDGVILDDFGNVIAVEEGIFVTEEAMFEQQFDVAPREISGLPLWARSLGTLAGLAAAMSLLAVRKLRSPMNVQSR